MEIIIKTDGSVGNTELFMNGRKVSFVEFDIMVSFLKKGKGVKMQLAKRTPEGRHYDFLSYYGGDFQKMDEMEKLHGRTEQSVRDNQEGNQAGGKEGNTSPPEAKAPRRV